MAIHFDSERMRKALENHEKWWRGELGRPLTCVKITDAYDAPEYNKNHILSQANCTDFSITPEQLVDAWDAELSRYEYLGDAFPMVGLEAFGPGIVAAFCGAKLDNSSGQVWFFPQETKEISEVHAKYNPDNIWTKRMKDIIRVGLKKWNGSVMIGFPDFGGILDIAASLVGTEELLFALIEEPEEVQRLSAEIQQAWYEAFDDFAEALKPQGGYTDWNFLLSKEPTHVLQCDFSIMVSPDMFEEFALDYLRKDTERLPHCIYHLDGPGALKHLDALLSLPEMSAIQWVYGDGQPGPRHWLDVYRKIHQSGKQFMILGDSEEFLDVLKAVPNSTPYSWHYLSKDCPEYAKKILEAR